MRALEKDDPMSQPYQWGSQQGSKDNSRRLHQKCGREKCSKMKLVPQEEGSETITDQHAGSVWGVHSRPTPGIKWKQWNGAEGDVELWRVATKASVVPKTGMNLPKCLLNARKLGGGCFWGQCHLWLSSEEGSSWKECQLRGLHH